MQVTDPICGIQIDASKAAASGTVQGQATISARILAIPGPEQRQTEISRNSAPQ